MASVPEHPLCSCLDTSTHTLNTGKDMDSGTAVRIFTLDTPILPAHPEFGDASVLAGADCMLTALETDVWLSRISEEISADVTWVVISATAVLSQSLMSSHT